MNFIDFDDFDNGYSADVPVTRVISLKIFWSLDVFL